MVHFANEDLPLETCGYLVGKKEEIIQVEKIIKMFNIKQSPEEYFFDEVEMHQVYKKVRKEGLELIGSYHSHPKTPARMSIRDIKLIAPNKCYVIISLKDTKPIIKAFIVEDNKPIELKIRNN
jgi:proteasome lid subunit RPN8/RPN11